MTRFLVFGHSVTHGYWDTEGGWVQRLRTFLDERALREQDEDLVHSVYKRGKAGDSTEELLERMETEINFFDLEESEHVIMVQIGENDIQYLVDEGEMKVPEDEFRENIRGIIEIAEEHAEEVVFVGDFPADPELEKVPHTETEKRISDERRRKYEQIKKEICDDQEVPYIDLFPIREEDSEELTVDGIHPTNEGHEMIQRKVKKRLQELNLI